MDSVKVSVVISTYNRANSLKRVIESIQIQTLSEIEILVCDDGSTDDTEDMVGRLAKEDGRIRYINCGHNGRPAFPRNMGIKEAKGEWIAFTDDDDYWNPTKLEAQVYMLEQHECFACCTNAYRLEDGKNLGVLYNKQETKLRKLGVEDFLGYNPVICSTTIVSRKLLKKTGGFPEEVDLKAIEDYALWVRLACYTPILIMPNPLIEYSVNSSDSIRQDQVQNFPEQKEKVLNALRIWLDTQPNECRRNLEIGKRKYILIVIKEKTVMRAWNEVKGIAKKVLKK